MSIRMIHPDLPGQPIDVHDPLAVEIHERSGWRLENVRDRPDLPARPSAAAVVPEGHVLAFHPASGQETVVPAESVPTLRGSGWLTKAEYEENERQAADKAAASQAKASRAAASKEE